MTTKIYHNPRCSKSRATLALLREHNIEPEIVEYLNTRPDAEEIRTLLDLLGLPARDIVRKGESAFRESGLTPDSPEDDLIALMAAEPIVIERPIVVAGGAARIGRPPENVMELLR